MEVNMRLWTTQPVVRLAQLEEHGVIHGSWEHLESLLLDTEDEFFWMRQYRWLAGEMEKRLPTFSGNPPIWARPEKIDLRSERTWGEPLSWKVCIEFEAPEGTYLFSDYSAWHNVLNLAFNSENEAEYDAFHARVKHREKKLAKERGCKRRDVHREVWEEFREEIESSWERIFEEPEGDPDWIGGGPVEWQVTVDGLHKEWVKDIRLFKVAPQNRWR